MCLSPLATIMVAKVEMRYKLERALTPKQLRRPRNPRLLLRKKCQTPGTKL